MHKKKRKKNPTRPGATFTRVITRGANVGDRVAFKVGPSGKPFPTRVLSDKGNNSTLKGDVPFGKKKKKSRKKHR